MWTLKIWSRHADRRQKPYYSWSVVDHTWRRCKCCQQSIDHRHRHLLITLSVLLCVQRGGGLCVSVSWYFNEMLIVYRDLTEARDRSSIQLSLASLLGREYQPM